MLSASLNKTNFTLLYDNSFESYIDYGLESTSTLLSLENEDKIIIIIIMDVVFIIVIIIVMLVMVVKMVVFVVVLKMCYIFC